MNIRIGEKNYEQLRECTYISFASGLSRRPESGCILLIAKNAHVERPSLLVTKVLTPDNGDLIARRSDGLVFSSRFLRRALLMVRELGLAGFLTVHTHPTSDVRVGFSWFDDRNDPSLMVNLFDLKPDGVFGSVVLGKRSMAARYWRPSSTQAETVDAMVVVGESLRWLSADISKEPREGCNWSIFDRGQALTQRSALDRISRMRVAVVGASGTGSLVVELLARAGVGEIVVFDFDQVEFANLNRMLHSRKSDAIDRVSKAERLATALRETELPTVITTASSGDVRCDEVALNLRQCDLIFGCVDKDWPRLILSQISYQYLIPYIDLGTEIGLGNDEVQSLDSRVSYVAPGRSCLVCSGIVSTDQVRLEGLQTEEAKRVLAMGYSRDASLIAPAVMDLNMRAASYAVLVFRHLLQGFLDSPLPTHIKETLTNYSTKAIRTTGNSLCLICGAEGRQGKGDSIRLTTRDAKRPEFSIANALIHEVSTSSSGKESYDANS